jgi:pentatricopeptide repeat protein
MARIRQVQAERKARELLGLADGYFKNGRMDLARQYYAKVISEYPQTQQAADAKAALERIR